MLDEFLYITRYTARTGFTLASLIAPDASDSNADLLKPIPVLGQTGVADTLILDGAGGPLYQPFLFRGNALETTPSNDVGCNRRSQDR